LAVANVVFHPNRNPRSLHVVSRAVCCPHFAAWHIERSLPIPAAARMRRRGSGGPTRTSARQLVLSSSLSYMCTHAPAWALANMRCCTVPHSLPSARRAPPRSAPSRMHRLAGPGTERLLKVTLRPSRAARRAARSPQSSGCPSQPPAREGRRTSTGKGPSSCLPS